MSVSINYITNSKIFYIIKAGNEFVEVFELK